MALTVSGTVRYDKNSVVLDAIRPPAGVASASGRTPTVTGIDNSGPANFPNASTTGVPAGTTLRLVPDEVSSGDGWVWNTGGWVNITGTGAVFDGFEVHASVNVMADGCTVSNCRVINSGNDNGIAIRHANNTIIRNCTVSGPSTGVQDDGRLTICIKDVYGDARGTQVIGCNVFGASAGIAMDDGLIADNYLHDWSWSAADHVDAIQSFDVGNLLEIRHNTILNQLGQTACILISKTLSGMQGNKLVTGNFMAGGGYCISCSSDTPTTPGQSHDLVFTNNLFSTQFFPNGGDFGVASHLNMSDPGNSWAGNTWADGPNAGGTVNA